MKIKKFNKNVMIPTKSHLSDVGYDIYNAEEFEIAPFETKVVGLGFGVQIPEGYSCMLVPRSSTAKKGIISQTQIIDPGYTGEIHLILTNCSNNTYHYGINDRIVSLCIYNVLSPYFEEVEEFEKTDRGENGLGSSGK